jgi:glycosyltransferase involved in cell wall biosynthesis
MSTIILAVSNDLSYDQRMHRICGSLARAGWDVTLVGRKRRSSQPLKPFGFKARRLNCLFERGKLFYAVLNFRLFWFLLFRKADVICAIDLDTWLACRWASRLKRARLAYDAHELFTEVPEVVRRPRIQKTWRRIEKKACTRSDIRYTVSQSIADHFSAKYGYEFRVIRNLPRLSQPTNKEPRTRNQELVVFYQGALNEGRCLEHLLHAMTQVNGRLLIAGEGDLSHKLRSLAAELGLQDKVEFLGWLQPDDLRVATAQATVGFNLLENSGLSYYYSLGNKFFDYIHAGLPQLCADIPEHRRINAQFEVAVLSNTIDPEAIASQLNRMLSAQELLDRLRSNCVIAKGELNWEKEEVRLLALYGTETLKQVQGDVPVRSIGQR